MTSTRPFPSGKAATRPARSPVKATPRPAKKADSGFSATKPAGTTKDVPLPTGGAMWEGSRSSRIAALLVGECESYTQFLEEERKLRAVGLNDMLTTARTNMNGTIGKAVQRASKITGHEYNTSVTVHLMQQPYRLAVTAVVTRTQ